jgi:transcriptional regulator with XRE-family HTH domain
MPATDEMIEPDWQAVARRLREVRGSLTQIEFGTALGVPQNIVSRYERARVKASLKYLIAVSYHRKVTLDWLLFGKGRKTVRAVRSEPRRNP